MNLDELMKEEPTLTLDPFEEQVKMDLADAGFNVDEASQESADSAAATGKKEASFTDYEEDLKYLTEEEKKKVDAFAKQISITDSSSVLSYGAGTQKKMADFSEGTLEKVKTKDLGEVGDMLSQVVVELKGFDDEEKKGVMGFFQKKANKVETMRAKYDKAEGNIDKTVQILERHQIQLMKDSAMLDKLYDLNKRDVRRMPRRLQILRLCAAASRRRFMILR